MAGRSRTVRFPSGQSPEIPGRPDVRPDAVRHKSMKTTLDVYKKQITPEAFSEGMKLLEAKSAEVAASNGDS